MLQVFFQISLVAQIISWASLLLSAVLFFSVGGLKKSKGEQVSLNEINEDLNNPVRIQSPNDLRVFGKKIGFEKSKTLFSFSYSRSFKISDLLADLQAGKWTKENVIKLDMLVSFLVCLFSFLVFFPSFLAVVFRLPAYLIFPVWFLGLFAAWWQYHKYWW